MPSEVDESAAPVVVEFRCTKCKGRLFDYSTDFTGRVIIKCRKPDCESISVLDRRLT